MSDTWGGQKDLLFHAIDTISLFSQSKLHLYQSPYGLWGEPIDRWLIQWWYMSFRGYACDNLAIKKSKPSLHSSIYHLWWIKESVKPLSGHSHQLSLTKEPSSIWEPIPFLTWAPWIFNPWKIVSRSQLEHWKSRSIRNLTSFQSVVPIDRCWISLMSSGRRSFDKPCPPSSVENLFCSWLLALRWVSKAWRNTQGFYSGTSDSAMLIKTYLKRHWGWEKGEPLSDMHLTSLISAGTSFYQSFSTVESRRKRSPRGSEICKDLYNLDQTHDNSHAGGQAFFKCRLWF